MDRDRDRERDRERERGGETERNILKYYIANYTPGVLNCFIVMHHIVVPVRHMQDL